MKYDCHVTPAGIFRQAVHTSSSLFSCPSVCESSGTAVSILGGKAEGEACGIPQVGYKAHSLLQLSRQISSCVNHKTCGEITSTVEGEVIMNLQLHDT